MPLARLYRSGNLRPSGISPPHASGRRRKYARGTLGNTPEPGSGLAPGPAAEPELVAWCDQADREWQGTLLPPAGRETGRPYPLIVQTRGQSPNEFVVDGPLGGAAFAALAFANAGFGVLQGRPIAGRI